MAETVLVADDEKNIRRAVRMVLEGEGLEVLEAETAEGALAMVETDAIDLLVLDVRLPMMSGLDALEKLRTMPAAEELPVVVISGHASISDAVMAVQRGATDFMEKPLDRERLVVTVRNALKTRRLARELKSLRAPRLGSRYQMIGESPVMQKLYAEIEKVAPTKGRVLITGESGTGKELVARAIHILSPRKDGPFVKVNCAAIPAELIESELFGHERGAFTGAQGRKKGFFEAAHGGTIFLDEIGDMTLQAQAKVLRVLQNEEITRVGGEQVVKVDVRVLCATHKNLEAAVQKGAFREDLYFRLNVVPLRTPALRERPEDIALLAAAFLEEFFRENGMRPKPVEDGVLDELANRPWMGNVRELRNVVERMAILSDKEITMEDVPEPGPSFGPEPDTDTRSSSERISASEIATGEKRETLREHRDRAERDYVRQTLDHCDWNISRAAAILGVERTNLHKKMRALGIKRGDGTSPA